MLAIEAKPLQTELSDKHAAQLIQYCSVEGIEWAALTNGRELQFFNAYLKGDLSAKRVLRLDLLAFNSAPEFDALFELLWQLSRESMTTPEGVHLWLNRRRMDAAIRAVLSDANSPTIRALRKALVDAEIKATAQDVTLWFASRVDVDLTHLPTLMIPSANSPSSGMVQEHLNPPNDPQGRTKHKHYGVKLVDLIDAGVLPSNAQLSLMKGKQSIASATLSPSGEIVYHGRAHRSPSDKAFVALMGGQSMNGWQHWHAEFSEGRVSLMDLRLRLNDSTTDAQ
jgi:hypothetical protein